MHIVELLNYDAWMLKKGSGSGRIVPILSVKFMSRILKKWAMCCVVFYPILHFLCIKFVFLLCPWCVPAVSMLYLGIIALEAELKLRRYE